MDGDDYFQYQINHGEKEDLISKAEQLVRASELATTREHWDSLNKIYHDQMDRWKEIGSAHGRRTKPSGGEYYVSGDTTADDLLWESFNEAREEFRLTRDLWFKNRKSADRQINEPAYFNKRQDKLNLIAEIQLLLHEKDVFEADKKAEEIFRRWKNVGHAGHYEEALWASFLSSKNAIKEKKINTLKERKSRQALSFETKKKIIEELSIMISKKIFDSGAEKLKEMHHDWKAAGSAGRADEELWKSFCEKRKTYQGIRGKIAQNSVLSIANVTPQQVDSYKGPAINMSVNMEIEQRQEKISPRYFDPGKKILLSRLANLNSSPDFWTKVLHRIMGK